MVFKVRIHEYKGREMGDENRGVRFEHGWIWSSAGEEWVHSSIYQFCHTWRRLCWVVLFSLYPDSLAVHLQQSCEDDEQRKNTLL